MSLRHRTALHLSPAPTRDRHRPISQAITHFRLVVTMAVSSAKPTPSATDMSVKVGGRVFHPALPVVDGAFPTEIEQKFQQSLAAFVADNISLESREGIQMRERVLDQMGVLCREWIRSVCASKGLAPDVIDMAGGALYTSGSYRLGASNRSLVNFKRTTDSIF